MSDLLTFAGESVSTMAHGILGRGLSSGLKQGADAGGSEIEPPAGLLKDR
jgi:hypothetical protein